MAETPKMPKAGRYTLRAPESFPATAFSATQAGNLLARIDPTIVGPSNTGFPVRFQRVSAKVFDRGGQKASMIGDYLSACGIKTQVTGDPQQLADLVEQTANQTYEADLDWEIVHRPSGFVLKGMRNFPSDGNGGYTPSITHPTEKNAEGEPLRLRANLVIKRFVAAS